MEDANNRGRLAKLIRFHTTQSTDKLTGLDEYLGRMKSGQKNIYFICGGSMEEVQRSPFLEKLQEQGYEVILFTEPMDEYMMQARSHTAPARHSIMAVLSASSKHHLCCFVPVVSYQLFSVLCCCPQD